MCINSTSLFYGVAVRTWTLARAVDAWPRLQPVSLFFNLVSLRLRCGTLSVSTESSKTSAIERVPIEVWELIKEELVDLELAEAEKGLIKEFCCDCEYWNPETDEIDLTSRCNSWNGELDATCPCEFCMNEGIWEFKRVWIGKRLEPAKLMLASFGLALASTTPLRAQPSWNGPSPAEDWDDPNTATFLFLPPASFSHTAQPIETLERSCRWDEQNEQAVLDVNFDVPSSSSSTFHRLIRTLRLEALAIFDDTRTPPSRGGKQVEAEQREQQSRFRVLKLDEVEPSWMMCTTCVTNW
ncbi:hypothetical protein JCM8547_002282 [Rhodosporidiobolus lusitaniae]